MLASRINAAVQDLPEEALPDQALDVLLRELVEAKEKAAELELSVSSSVQPLFIAGLLF